MSSRAPRPAFAVGRSPRHRDLVHHRAEHGTAPMPRERLNAHLSLPAGRTVDLAVVDQPCWVPSGDRTVVAPDPRMVRRADERRLRVLVPGLGIQRVRTAQFQSTDAVGGQPGRTRREQQIHPPVVFEDLWALVEALALRAVHPLPVEVVVVSQSRARRGHRGRVGHGGRCTAAGHRRRSGPAGPHPARSAVVVQDGEVDRPAVVGPQIRIVTGVERAAQFVGP